jgi:hypothetical protein
LSVGDFFLKDAVSDNDPLPIVVFWIAFKATPDCSLRWVADSKRRRLP